MHQNRQKTNALFLFLPKRLRSKLHPKLTFLAYYERCPFHLRRKPILILFPVNISDISKLTLINFFYKRSNNCLHTKILIAIGSSLQRMFSRFSFSKSAHGKSSLLISLCISGISSDPSDCDARNRSIIRVNIITFSCWYLST